MITNTKIKSLLIMLFIFAFAMAGCGSSGSPEESDAGGDGLSTAESTGDDIQQNPIGITLKEFSEDELLAGLHNVEMDIEGKGTVKLELNADQAPISVTNFINLAEEGFYNGLSFHRILAGSLVQGGSPTYDATGSVGYNIKGEFALNGVDNTLSHTRGAISMARTSDYNGGGCQFFIMTSDYTGYDGQYAVFGYVTEGMEIIDDICNNTPVQDWNGTVAMEDQPIITEIRVVE